MGANKTIHFMEVCWRDAQDNVSAMEPGFWRFLSTELEGLTEAERTVPYMGVKLEGEGGRDRRTSLDYVYVAKERAPMDRPHTRQMGGSYGVIQDGPTVRGIYEPTYAAAVGTTNVAAFMRSSGAAGWSAIEDWLNGVLPHQPNGLKIALRAVVSGDGFEELRRSLGVAKIHVKGSGDAFREAEPAGNIASAVKEAGRVTGGLSVDLTLSFGHVTPDDYSAEQLKHDLEAFLNANKESFTHGSGNRANATLMFRRDDGRIDRRPVDFIYNKITTKERVDLEGGEPTRESVLIALQSAIRRYQNNEL